MKIYKFFVEVPGDVLSYTAYPIYDDEMKQLLGAFSLERGNRVYGFVSGENHPVAIMISTGESFYFTPRDGSDGKVAYGIISDFKLSHMSIKVNKAE